MSDKETLGIEEEALFEQEQGLLEMEKDMHARELELAVKEGLFQDKNASLLQLAQFVEKQEQDLLQHAKLLRVDAYQKVLRILGHADELAIWKGELGHLEAREALFHERQKLVEERLQLLEERENLYALRMESLVAMEAGVGNLQAQLLSRQAAFAEATSRMITSNPAHPARLSNPPPTKEKETAPKTSSFARPDVKKMVRSKVSESPGPEALAEGTLALQLGPEGSSFFFKYHDDAEDDLPGLFVPGEGPFPLNQKLSLELSFPAQEAITVSGVVAWVRSPEDKSGEPGMGLELIDLTEQNIQSIISWCKNSAPVIL